MKKRSYPVKRHQAGRLCRVQCREYSKRKWKHALHQCLRGSHFWTGSGSAQCAQQIQAQASFKIASRVLQAEPLFANETKSLCALLRAGWEPPGQISYRSHKARACNPRRRTVWRGLCTSGRTSSGRNVSYGSHHEVGTRHCKTTVGIFNPGLLALLVLGGLGWLWRVWPRPAPALRSRMSVWDVFVARLFGAAAALLPTSPAARLTWA